MTTSLDTCVATDRFPDFTVVFGRLAPSSKLVGRRNMITIDITIYNINFDLLTKVTFTVRITIDIITYNINFDLLNKVTFVAQNTKVFLKYCINSFPHINQFI